MHYEIDYRYLAELLIYIFSFLSSSHGPSHLISSHKPVETNAQKSVIISPTTAHRSKSLLSLSVYKPLNGLTQAAPMC